ncbi:MAG: FAD-dependent thymidylate synthase [Candidatus Saganbacteria bacterium]|nr:FAD-dependent thymidylate synthase [Candidatus Saganbacteria bacterium]
MQINLAGYNIDAEVLEELKKGPVQRQDVTPETISAAYARISRDPRPIDELRKAARQEVEKARKSNSSIIFKMGHHSVAEHAVFNFDLIAISRLAVEHLEHFRLCSFTEKSQRYITLEDDFVVPEEIKGSKAEGIFVSTIKEQNRLYHRLNEKLQAYVLKKHAVLAKDPKNGVLLEGWAKEDARYVTALATQAQLGLTVNARNLELMFRRFASQPLSEIKEISKKMYGLAAKIAPSIILFTEANEFDAKTYQEIKSKINSKIKIHHSKQPEVRLIDHTKDADDVLVASLMFAVSGEDFESCEKKVKKMSLAEKELIVKTSGKYMQFYDTVLREFENIDVTFEVMLSSSCFAQLKRHRMATIITQPYDISLGVTVPPSIDEIGMKKAFMEIIARTEKAYEIVMKTNSAAAPYVLTNAHRRRVLFKCNARELYHLSRLREDSHAQWDICNISRIMSEETKKVMPFAMMFIGGKDGYPGIYKKIFGEYPKVMG